VSIRFEEQTMTKQIDTQVTLVVLGGGPGGYPAAFDAADRGMNVTLVNEEPKPGGVCLNRGCIPSKVLLHIAKFINEAREATEWGITFGEPVIDLDRVREFKNKVIDKLTGGVSQLCEAHGVNVVQARGTLLDSKSLQLQFPDGNTEQREFDHLILATGSSPVMPKLFDIGDPRVMDSTAALELAEIPQRLLVVGGGYIGLEMGSVYAALGSKVTVVEMMPGLLPGVDRDLVGPLKKRLETLFDAIYLNTKVVSVTAEENGIVAVLDGEYVEPEQTFDRVLVSVGRKPNMANIGLENTQVNTDERGFVKTDPQQRTTDPRISAIGDVAGEPMLAHKATRQAKVAVAAIAGESVSFDETAIPAVVFTDPELAWCGLTETQARANKIQVKTSRFPWAASGRAQTLARTEGLTKIIFDPESQRILGVGIVGTGAGELIAEGTLAIDSRRVLRDLAESIHAHPTLSETIMESAEAALGQATHLFRRGRR
jgi:dihydrolipoamide dehydrogenase